MLAMARIRRSEKTRENLLEQGINLLSEHGYHGTGLKLILDTVKVPKGSFYNYFASKEHFAAEILDTYTAQLLAQFDQYAAKSNESPLELIKNVYGIMLKSFEAEGHIKGCLLGNMAAEIGGHSELCTQSMLKTLEQWKRRIVALIEKGQQEDLIRQDISATQLTNLLWCTWEGGLLRMKIEGNTETVAQVLELLFQQIFVSNKSISEKNTA